MNRRRPHQGLEARGVGPTLVWPEQERSGHENCDLVRARERRPDAYSRATGDNLFDESGGQVLFPGVPQADNETPIFADKC